MQYVYNVNTWSSFQTANLSMNFWNTTHISLGIALFFKHYNSLANKYKVRVLGDHVLELDEKGHSLNINVLATQIFKIPCLRNSHSHVPQFSTFGYAVQPPIGKIFWQIG